MLQADENYFEMCRSFLLHFCSGREYASDTLQALPFPGKGST